MDEINRIFEDFANNPKVKVMSQFKQHGQITTYDHCVHVVNVGLKLAKKLRCTNEQMQNLIVGGMLHDYFLYDYHITGARLPEGIHAWVHPSIALKEADKTFELNNVQRNIIETHMFPTTLRHIPKSKEAWIVCLVDKYCATAEYVVNIIYKLRHRHQQAFN